MENIVWTTKIWAWSGLTYTRVWILPGPQCTDLKGKKYTHAHLDLFLNLLDLSIHVEICESTPRASVPIQHPVVHFMAPPSHVHAFPLTVRDQAPRMPLTLCNQSPTPQADCPLHVDLPNGFSTKEERKADRRWGRREGGKEGGRRLSLFLSVLSVFCFMWFDTLILDA